MADLPSGSGTSQLAAEPHPTVSLPIPLGLTVVVPDSLASMTPYVLLEQEDWFEDEIHFVRRALRKGQRALDIGANCGLYALTIARQVGAEGRVWAFEPGRNTAQMLRRSVAANRLSQLEIVECALSNREGEAQLYTRAQSELNSLQPVAGTVDGLAETVRVRTLDACARELNWGGLAFIKLDAEGEEANILEGARELLERESPLVMFEVKHGETRNLSLLRSFVRRGFATYRLVPGLGVLVPMDEGEKSDPFLLNAFACKPDRAAALEAEGLLVRVVPPAPSAADGARAGLLSQFPYAARLLPGLAGFGPQGGAGALKHCHALDLFALARQADASPGMRWACLRRALEVIADAWDGREPVARLQTLARLAADAGQRALAVEALQNLITMLTSGRDLVVDEPFLAVSARYEALDPGERVGDWLLSSVLERWEQLRAFSSFHAAPPVALERLAALERLGFESQEMARRRHLLARRTAGPAAHTGIRAAPV